MTYDVVIVGASVAGCTAAIAYGRAGLRVALLEKHRSPEAYKALCGHFILAGTEPTLRRLGIWEPMRAAGAVAGHLRSWNDYGWQLPPPPDAPSLVNLRRSRLDPLLRRLAAETPGVDLLLGRRVVALEVADGRIAGVRAETAGGAEETYRGRLVVGADGHRSRVASLAGVRERVDANGRFLCFGYYAGVAQPPAQDFLAWFRGADIAVVGATDGGLTQVALMLTNDQLPAFRADRAAAARAYVATLPEAPELPAEPVARMSLAEGYDVITRHPAPRPGLALIGDAAMTSDPVPAPGCGWAFRSAEMLARATAPALSAGTGLDRGLRAYRRDHRELEGHHAVMRAEARATPPNAALRMLRRAATADAEVARRMYLFGMRATPVRGLLNPAVLARAARIARMSGQSIQEPQNCSDLLPRRRTEL